MAAAGRACARHRRAAVECPGPVTVRICDLLTDPRRCERPPAPSRPPARPTLRWRAGLRPRAPASVAGGDSEDRGPEVVPPPCFRVGARGGDRDRRRGCLTVRRRRGRFLTVCRDCSIPPTRTAARASGRAMRPARPRTPARLGGSPVGRGTRRSPSHRRAPRRQHSAVEVS